MRLLDVPRAAVWSAEPRLKLHQPFEPQASGFATTGGGFLRSPCAARRLCLVFLFCWWHRIVNYVPLIGTQNCTVAAAIFQVMRRLGPEALQDRPVLNLIRLLNRGFHCDREETRRVVVSRN